MSAADQMPVKRQFNVCRTHGNKHGYRGVEWEAARQMFRARIEPEPGVRGKWLGRFATAEQAALAYDDAARQAYGALARLNFPGPGEMATEQSRKAAGLCPAGHDLVENGYRRPDGRGVTCRKCNREAVMRNRLQTPKAK